MINKKLTSIDPSDPWFAAFSAACKKQYEFDSHCKLILVLAASIFDAFLIFAVMSI